MSESAVRLGASGELHLSGALDYRSGPALRKQGQALIKATDATALILDCSEVEKSSSVGLSLLLAFMRDAHAEGKVVSVQSLPQDMRDIAQVSGLTELFDQHQ